MVSSISTEQARVSETHGGDSLGKPYVRDSPHNMCWAGRHKTLCRMRVILVKAGLSGVRVFFGKTSPKYAAEPRDRPYADPEPPKGLGLGLVGVRLKLTTHVLHIFLCRPIKHIAEALPKACTFISENSVSIRGTEDPVFCRLERFLEIL